MIIYLLSVSSEEED